MDAWGRWRRRPVGCDCRNRGRPPERDAMPGMQVIPTWACPSPAPRRQNASALRQKKRSWSAAERSTTHHALHRPHRRVEAYAQAADRRVRGEHATADAEDADRLAHDPTIRGLVPRQSRRDAPPGAGERGGGDAPIPCAAPVITTTLPSPPVCCAIVACHRRLQFERR